MDKGFKAFNNRTGEYLGLVSLQEAATNVCRAGGGDYHVVVEKLESGELVIGEGSVHTRRYFTRYYLTRNVIYGTIAIDQTKGIEL